MSKRGQNEGSIYKRNDRRWVAVVSLGYRRGKRWRKSFYGDTRKEVQEKLTAALRAHQQGLPVAPERQTFGQFLERWLANSVKPTVRPLTYERYAQLVRLHITPVLGRIPLAKLGPQEVQAFLNAKRKDGLSPRTVQYLHVTLRCALGQAVKWESVPRNVAKLVDTAKVERPEVKPFTPEEARAFMAAVSGERLNALYSVALAVGLRKGEALGLRWQDVNLDAGTLKVRVALQLINGKLQLVQPKTARSRRTIALPQSSVVALRAHRARQLEERLLAGPRWKDSGLVFPSSVGTPMNPRNLNRHFERVLNKTGLPRKRFHDLRHTCATLLLAQDVHPRVVMEILGHSQISLTMDTYSHVVPSLQREAADRMDTLLAQKS